MSQSKARSSISAIDLCYECNRGTAKRAVPYLPVIEFAPQLHDLPADVVRLGGNKVGG